MVFGQRRRHASALQKIGWLSVRLLLIEQALNPLNYPVAVGVAVTVGFGLGLLLAGTHWVRGETTGGTNAGKLALLTTSGASGSLPTSIKGLPPMPVISKVCRKGK